MGFRWFHYESILRQNYFEDSMNIQQQKNKENKIYKTIKISDEMECSSIERYVETRFFISLLFFCLGFFIRSLYHLSMIQSVNIQNWYLQEMIGVDLHHNKLNG